MNTLTIRRSALALLMACAACENTPTVPPAPLFQISDGAHGGNSGFYWLPPIVVPQPVFTGVFDGTRSPVVRVCEWDGTICTATIAEFTMETGPGSETVRMVPEDEHYIVNFHTDAFELSPDVPLRIDVAVDGFVLGHADVEVVSKGGGLWNVDRDEAIVLPDGKTLAIKFRIEEGAIPSSFTSSSVVLDGVDDVVDMGALYPFFGNEAGSLSIWFTTNALREAHLIGRQGPGFTRRGYFLHLDPAGNVCFSQVANELSLRQRECTATAPTLGEWHHVVATWQSAPYSFAGTTLYVDGVEADTDPIGQDLGNNSVANSGGNFTVGLAVCSSGPNCLEEPAGDGIAHSRAFEGHLDEAAIYLAELTAAQVAEIYNGGSPPDLAALPSTPLPSSWWRMGECTDLAQTLVCDEGVNSFDGMLFDGAAFSTQTP